MATGKKVGQISRKKGKMYAVNGKGEVREYAMKRKGKKTTKKK